MSRYYIWTYTVIGACIEFMHMLDRARVDNINSTGKSAQANDIIGPTMKRFITAILWATFTYTSSMAIFYGWLACHYPMEAVSFDTQKRDAVVISLVHLVSFALFFLICEQNSFIPWYLGRVWQPLVAVWIRSNFWIGLMILLTTVFGLYVGILL